MGKEISLFSGYDQPENRTTNYCLLMLRLLYQENPALLAQALSALLPGQTGVQVGVQFRQQVLRNNAVPDGILSQPAFTVYVETKHATGTTMHSWSATWKRCTKSRPAPKCWWPWPNLKAT